MRGGAVAARRAHNPKVVGSNPTPATSFTLATQNLFLGGKSMMAPPVPIPNTEVKRHSAHDTAPARVWENRSLPGLFHKQTPHLRMGRFAFKRVLLRASSNGLVTAAIYPASNSLAKEGGQDIICVRRRMTRLLAAISPSASRYPRKDLLLAWWGVQVLPAAS